MAKEAKPAADAVEAPPPKKSKKLLIIIVAALLLIAGLGGGAFYLIRSHAQQAEDGDGSEKAQAAKKKDAKEAAPVYVALEPFTVNLVPENGDQFLQLIISIEVVDSHVGDRVKAYTPKLRNNVMMLLSGKKASELITKDGKETLANEIRDLINDILEPGGGKAKAEEAPVKEVLFTSFIIQ